MLSGIFNKARQSKELIIQTQQEFYLPGDTLNGRVTFQPKKDLMVECVKVFFCGKEYCFWMDKVLPLSMQTPNTSLVLFKKHILLVGTRTPIASGMHAWNFSFTVPRGIPPSCSYKRQAQIEYHLKAKVCTKFGHFDFGIYYPLFIGQLTFPTMPLEIFTRERLQSGAINMRAVCSHSVAKSHQAIFCTIHITNESSRSITSVRLKLKQHWKCCDMDITKNAVCTSETRQGFPLGRGTFEGTLHLIIPDLDTCPTVTNATNFSCTYYIGVYICTKVGGIQKRTLMSKLPITISNSSFEDNIPIPPSPPGTFIPTEHSFGSLSSLQNEPLPSRNSFSELMEELHALDWEVNPENPRNSSINNVEVPDPDIDAVQVCDPDMILNDTTSIPSEQPPERKNGECIICFDGPKNMLMLPCAHIATCSSCATEIMKRSRQCPVCRTKVSQVLRTFQV